jgi:5-methylthioribose kinase
MYRRVIGLAGVEDIRGIEDVNAKTVAATVAMNMGHVLLMQRDSFGTIEALMDAVEAVKPS